MINLQFKFLVYSSLKKQLTVLSALLSDWRPFRGHEAKSGGLRLPAPRLGWPPMADRLNKMHIVGFEPTLS